MKVKLKKLATLVFALLILPILYAPASAIDEDPTIRIGLYYGSSAMPSANLENYSGSGYYFGWWNSAYEFVSVGYTSQTTITTMKDKNMYLSSGLYYDTPTAASYSTIGAYHLQLNTVYGSFEEASSVASSYSNAFPAYINGEYRVRIGNYTSTDSAYSAASSLGISGQTTVVGMSSTCYTVTVTGTTTILFEFDYGTRTAFGINPDITGVNNNETWFKGYRYYGGFEYKRLSGNDITVINYVSIHDYVKGILPYEMSASWPIEALKAQALCAKSYTLCNLNKHSASGFDLCNTTDCQVYRGTSSATSNSDKAVDDTYGLYVLYNGSPAQTFYFSSDGGATEDSINVWSSDLPYLKGVIDPYEETISIPGYTWEYTYTTEQLTWLLNQKGYTIGNIVNCYVSKTTNTGNVYSVTFVDSSGKVLSLNREAARTVFYSATLGYTTTSQRFTITANYEGNGTNVYVNNASSTISSLNGAYAINGSGSIGTIDGDTAYAVTDSGNQTVTASGTSGETPVSFTVSGKGSGHNVGMSQWGAYAMASKGMTYDQIIKFYFTGVTIGR